MIHIKLFEQIHEEELGKIQNDYPKNIIKILELVGFNKEDNYYIKGNHKLVLDHNKLIYLDENDDILFEITKDILSGTFLVLLQEFKIINHRYIYERVDVIEKSFFYDD